MYHLVNGLGRKRIRLNIDKLVSEMIWYHENEGFRAQNCSSWLFPEGSLNNVSQFQSGYLSSLINGQANVVNFIRTQQCIKQDTEADVMLFFSSHFLQTTDTSLEILAQVLSTPHQLNLEPDGNEVKMAFRNPLPGANPPIPAINVTTRHNDVYHATATSYFPGNVRFERVFRVRLKVSSLHKPTPEATVSKVLLLLIRA